MSKSTLVSIVPFPVAEFKPGIYPGFFEVPASTNNIPQTLVISDSVYHVEIDEDRNITVKCPSEDIAKSVVDDYIISNLAYSPEDNSAPGFFWVPGVATPTKIQTEFSELLKENVIRQHNWFKKLVEMADDDWEKTRQHKFISDMQRYAAKSMKLERPWIISTTQEGLIKCIACQSLISPSAVICPHCRVILNNDKWKAMQFATEVNP